MKCYQNDDDVIVQQQYKDVLIVALAGSRQWLSALQMTTMIQQ
jgi:hypothetical protein